MVTYQEAEALKSLGPCSVWDRERLEGSGCLTPEPWGWDEVAAEGVRFWSVPGVGQGEFPELAHVYAGTFSKTVEVLRRNGCRVAYTAAAHDVAVSRRAHLDLGLDYDALYPHLVDPDAWSRYLAGYKAADALVCPSSHSAAVMRKFGCRNRVEVIPHGCTLPQRVQPPPSTWTVGYLGGCGAPDKNLKCLLRAWKKLAYRNAVLLLGGRDSNSPWVHALVEQFGGGTVVLLGWVKDPADFYNRISLLVQPSLTEGFGLEVLEAMSFGRPVLCSTGAGASDLVPGEFRFSPDDPDELAGKIDRARIEANWTRVVYWRGIAENHTWDKVRARYVALWKELLTK
jgi:glycosyltransferase involved in cell wall biosynthesis